jgi:hypothetical protein
MSSADKATLFERGSYHAYISKTPDPQAIDLLNKMSVGTSGAQYQLKTIAERLSQIEHPYFMYMLQRDKLTGNLMSAHREVQSSIGRLNAFYIRYFVFKDAIRASAISAQSAKANKADGFFKSYIKRLLSRPAFDLGVDYGEDRSLPFLTYAFIDSDNFRSSNMSETFGLHPISKFDTFSFTRLSPKKDQHVKQLNTSLKLDIKSLLRRHYRSFSMYDEQYLFLKDNYFIYEKDGKVLAGVQVNVSEWEVKKIKGLMGNIAMNVVPKVPGIRSYFNPKSFKFLTFDYLYHELGREKELELLLESVLAIFELHFALSWQEVKSPYHRFFSEVNRGTLSNFNNVPSAHYMASMPKMDVSQKRAISDSPLFMCGLDMS